MHSASISRIFELPSVLGPTGDGVGLTVIEAASLLCLSFPFLNPSMAEQLPVKAYTTAEGLANNHINRIRQDSRGYLWFCTDGGLSRFDGYRFINYTTEDGLPHPWVNDLLETRDGTYWIATDGGVCRFNPNGHSTRQSASDVTGVRPASGKSQAAGAEPMFVLYHLGLEEGVSRVNALAEDASGGIWCATYAGLYRFRQAGDNMEPEFVDVGLPRNTYEGRLVNNIVFGDDGTLWIAARCGLFRRHRDGRSERYITAHGLPDNFVETVFRDHGGRWWIGTRARGFCSLVGDPEPDHRVTANCYSTTDGLPGNDVRSIFQSSTGALWIGTIGGLTEFDPEGPRFQNYTTPNGLSSAVIYKVSEDRDRNLWIGTRDNGVMKIAGSGFVTYGAQDSFLTGNADASVFEGVNGELLVVTAIGAHAFIERFDGAKFIATEINLPRYDARSAVWLRPGSFQDRSGEWWVATIGGFFRFPKTGSVEDLTRLRPHLIYDVTHGLQGNALSQIHQDMHGDVWIAAKSYDNAENHAEIDLARWERVTDRLHHYPVREALPRLKKNEVTALGEDASGNLWIGFDRGGGLVRYRGGRFEEFQPGHGAFKGAIRTIFLDHAARLWVGSTQAGLSRIDNPGLERPKLTRYTTLEGLSSNEILCITEDRFGRIYLGMNRGVDRLNPTAQTVGGEPLGVKHYTWTDGLAKGAVRFAFRDRQDKLWFVTNDGLSRFVPVPDPAPIPPPVLITGLRIMGVPQPLSQLGETQVAGLELLPSHNHVEIEFLSLDFRQGVDLRYQYMLEDTDQHWGTPTDQRRVVYPGLTPRAYRFLVRAVSSDGRISSQPAVVAFTVLAPVWRRGWFMGLEAALAALIIYGLYHYRLSQLLAMERIRTRIATDLHDDIGSSLSQVAILSEVVCKRIGESAPELKGPLSRIASVSRELVDSMSDIVWAIDPAKDMLSYLEQRMREFAGDVFTASDIHFQFPASGLEQDLAIGTDVRRQVFLIFKECVHNIIRHANCSQVEICLRIESERLVVQVRDNGVGFEPVAAASGHGLVSMRDRAHRLGGRLAVAADNRGTAVTLEVPLKRAPVWREVLAKAHWNRWGKTP